MFGNCLFTFLIGPEKCKFVIHEDVVSKISPVLCAMMNSQMKEGESRIAELPEVDPETFQNFVSYSYFHAYHNCSEGKNVQTPKFSRSKVIELLLLHNHKTFKCKSCYGRSNLKFSVSFPKCQKCANETHRCAGWMARCVTSTCSEMADGLDGLLCGQCLASYGVINYAGTVEGPKGLRKIQLEYPQTSTTLKWFHFDMPLRAEELASAMENFTCGLHLPCTGLLEITKLAIFADCYHIDTLIEATCLALYKVLANEFLHDDSIQTITQVAKTIYEATPETEPKPFEEKHILRRMISEFIATRLGNPILPIPTEAFRSQKEDLYLDIMNVIVQKSSEGPGDS